MAGTSLRVRFIFHFSARRTPKVVSFFATPSPRAVRSKGDGHRGEVSVERWSDILLLRIPSFHLDKLSSFLILVPWDHDNYHHASPVPPLPSRCTTQKHYRSYHRFPRDSQLLPDWLRGSIGVPDVPAKGCKGSGIISKGIVSIASSSTCILPFGGRRRKSIRAASLLLFLDLG